MVSAFGCMSVAIRAALYVLGTSACCVTLRHGLNSEWDLAGVNNEPARVVN